MKRRLFLWLLLGLSSLLGFSQVKKTIKKSRRNKTENQLSLPENYLQFEWEGGVEKINKQLSTGVHPNLNIRYGLSKKWELNWESNWVTVKQKTTTLHSTVNGIEPMQPGVVWYPMEETNQHPAMAVSMQLAVPFMASTHFKADRLGGTMQLTLQKSLGDRWLLASSGGAYWDGFSTNPYFVYLVAPVWQFSSRCTGTLEFFGYIGSIAPLTNTDINIMYTVSKKCQLGFTAGTGLSSAAPASYFAINCVNGFMMSSPHRKN